MREETPARLFVYGTLQSGWPAHALLEPFVLRVTEAHIQGALYAAQVPLLVEGDGVVRGELLDLAPDDLSIALALADEFEAYDPLDPQHSLYVRRLTTVRIPNAAVRAFVYFYNLENPSGTPLAALKPIPGNAWPSSP